MKINLVIFKVSQYAILIEMTKYRRDSFEENYYRVIITNGSSVRLWI
jgi:hypothetical protein